MRGAFIYYAFEDPLLMCTLLLHSAVHLDIVQKRQQSKITLRLGMEAAKLMNLYLDSKDLYLKDTTIAAVILMLANQVAFFLPPFMSLSDNMNY